MQDTETGTLASKGTYQPTTATVLSGNQTGSAGSNPQALNPYANINFNDMYSSANMEAGIAANAVSAGMSFAGGGGSGGDDVCYDMSDGSMSCGSGGGSGNSSGNVAAPSDGADESGLGQGPVVPGGSCPGFCGDTSSSSSDFAGFGGGSAGGDGAGGSWDDSSSDTVVDCPACGGSATVSGSAPDVPLDATPGAAAASASLLPLAPDGSSLDSTVLSGHGEWNLANGTITVPEGTAVTLPTALGNEITDAYGNALETGGDLTPFVGEMTGATTYLPGAEIPNMTLSAPTADLTIMGDAVTVAEPTLLEDLIGPGMGNVIWAACTVICP